MLLIGRTLERLLAVGRAGYCGRFDRVLACEFYRASANCGEFAACFSLRWLLEDVLDRHSIGRDSLPAGIFPGAHREVPVDFPAG